MADRTPWGGAPLDELQRTVAGIVDLSGRRRSAEIVASLELATEQLADAAHAIGADEPEGRRLLDVRDLIAAHVRAAGHLSAAGARAETHDRLVLDAARLLAEACAPAGSVGAGD